MNTERAIKERKSVRAYTDKPIEEEKLRAILLAGNDAPSAMNNQNRIIIAIMGESAKQKLNSAVKSTASEETIARIEGRNNGEFNFFYKAPALIVVASTDKLYPEADCATCIENMMLRATDLGLGTCWINQLTKTTNSEVIALLKKIGLPDGATVYGSMAVGYGDGYVEKKVKTNKIIIVR